jgi:hypothetical protein
MSSMDETQEGRENIRRDMRRIELGLPDKGVTVNYLTPEERAAWQSHVGDLRGEIVAAIGGRAQEVIDAIEAGKVAFSARTIESSSAPARHD